VSASWVMLTANITPEQNADLRRVLEHLGMNRAEWVRSCIDHAVATLALESVGRDTVAATPHTCDPRVLERYGASIPWAKKPGRGCWPDLPSDDEKRASSVQAMAGGFGDLPGWAWIHQRRRLPLE